MAKKASLSKTLEGLPWIVRLILVILGDLYGNIVRLLRSVEKNNIIGIILSVVLLCSGGLLILWIIEVFLYFSSFFIFFKNFFIVVLI